MNKDICPSRLVLGLRLICVQINYAYNQMPEVLLSIFVNHESGVDNTKEYDQEPEDSPNKPQTRT